MAEKLNKPIKYSDRWRAKAWQKYYYIKRSIIFETIENGDKEDLDRWLDGNYFQTSKLALEEIRRLELHSLEAVKFIDFVNKSSIRLFGLAFIIGSLMALLHILIK